mgnify:CR=1 FL=1
MTKISIIDCETASMKGNVCEIGISKFISTPEGKFELQGCYADLVNPLEKIDYEAMNVHHITEYMVQGKPYLEDILHKYSLEDSEYVVAHNIVYEEAVLPEDYFPQGIKRLCTLKLARALYPKGTVKSHKLGVLFYSFGLDRDERVLEFKGTWHRAAFDTLITGLVLEYMLMDKGITIEEAYQLVQPDITRCKFKKYSQKSWKEVVREDESYVEWLLENIEWNCDKEKAYVADLLVNTKYA